MELIERWINLLVAAWPLVLIVFAVVYPFLPGPIKTWIQARREEARSNTHLNDTKLLLDTMWRGYQEARAKGIDPKSAIMAGVTYIGVTRPDLIVKMGATPQVMTSMLTAEAKDREELMTKMAAAMASVPSIASAVETLRK